MRQDRSYDLVLALCVAVALRVYNLDNPGAKNSIKLTEF